MELRPPSATQLATVRAAFPAPPGFRPLIHDIPTVLKQSMPLVCLNGRKSSGAKVGRLAPGTIDSICVISPQVGTALYGSRGRNGAIVFTSKNHR
jgi:hypothetical protein